MPWFNREAALAKAARMNRLPPLPDYALTVLKARASHAGVAAECIAKETGLKIQSVYRAHVMLKAHEYLGAYRQVTWAGFEFARGELE